MHARAHVDARARLWSKIGRRHYLVPAPALRLPELFQGQQARQEISMGQHQDLLGIFYRVQNLFSAHR